VELVKKILMLLLDGLKAKGYAIYMRPPNCYLTVSGALQEYLKKSPPIFIPGRRLSDTEEPE
jgi:hypothetical protein